VIFVTRWRTCLPAYLFGRASPSIHILSLIIIMLLLLCFSSSCGLGLSVFLIACIACVCACKMLTVQQRLDDNVRMIVEAFRDIR